MVCLAIVAAQWGETVQICRGQAECGRSGVRDVSPIRLTFTTLSRRY
jgi:hypothetical protein